MVSRADHKETYGEAYWS